MQKMNQPIRVLCVFSKLDRGGAESMCMNLYRTIDRNKVQFDFVKHTPEKGQFEDEITSLGGRIYEAPTYRLFNHLRYCMWWRKHLKEHIEHRIIHGHYFTIAAIYLKIAKQFNRVTITHAHAERGPTENIRLALRVKLAIAERAEKYSDYCFACSKNAGDWLFPNRTYRIINNAIDADSFAPNENIRKSVRKEFHIDKNQLVIGVIGSISAVKNPTGVINIFNVVHQQQVNSMLLWCGDGAQRQIIEDKVKLLELTESVIFAGVRNDIPRMLQAMDVYIMPSLHEGIPVAGIEAQAAGIPCFFSDKISKDVAITNCCMFLPLDNLDLWKNQILQSVAITRTNQKQAIIDAGYDIRTSALWLENFYLNI